MSVSPTNNLITTSTDYASSWAMVNDTSLYTLTITNKNSYKIRIKKITIKVGRGEDNVSLYGTGGWVTTAPSGRAFAAFYTSMSNNASPCSNEKEATKSVGLAKEGTSPAPKDTGYFDDISSDSSYNKDFIINTSTDIPGNNSSRTYYLRRTGTSDAGVVVTTRKVWLNEPVVEWEPVGSTDLPTPSISYSPSPALYNKATTVTVNKNTSTDPAADVYCHVTFGGGSAVNFHNVKVGTYPNKTFKVPETQIEAQNRQSGHIDSNIAEKSVSIKLNEPTDLKNKIQYETSPGTWSSPVVFQGSQISIGERLVASASAKADGTNNPSGTNVVETWYDGNTAKTQSGVNIFAPTDSPVNYYHFKAACVHSGNYSNSDQVYCSYKVKYVIFCPEKMIANGFTYSFKHTDNTPMVAGEVIVPGSSLKVSWSSFPISKHLGNFNKYDIDLVKGNSSTLIRNLVTNGTNDPSSSNEKTVTLLPGQDLPAGNDYKLRLTAHYNNNKTTSDNSNVFESPSFIIGGKPEIEIEYPSGTTSGSRAATCNKNPRLIFSINPGGFSDVTLTNLKVSTDNGTSWTPYNPDVEYSNILYSRIDPDGTYHIVYVLPTSSATSRNIKIKCTNSSNIESDEVSVYIKYITSVSVQYGDETVTVSLNNAQSGEEISAVKVIGVAKALQSVVNGYPTKYRQSIQITIPFRDDLHEIEIRKISGSSDDFLRTKYLQAVSSIYTRLSADGSCTVKLSNGNYERDSTKEIDISREAGLSRGDPANAYGPIDTSNQYYTGNIFNHIIDGLKYML